MKANELLLEVGHRVMEVSGEPWLCDYLVLMIISISVQHGNAVQC